MVVTDPYANLAPWRPATTQIPEDWEVLADTLARQTKGLPRRYVLDVRYDAQRVGDRLRSWGLPWQMVMAGYLWGYDEEQIRQASLKDVDEVLGHINEANIYARYIEDENLPPLLSPPYRDLGALLVAVTIYYQILETTLQEQSNEHADPVTMPAYIEYIGHILLNIATRLGMWHFKHDIEDLCEQLRSPHKFVEAKQEHIRILQQDSDMLEKTRRLFTSAYQEATQQPISVTYTACGIGGMKRRKQDAHTTATSQKTQLTGFDLVTFDVVVPTVQKCYTAFGVMSQLGQIQDRVTDLIATPKANGCSHIALGLILKPQFSHDLAWLQTNTHACQIQIATHLMQAINWYGCLHPSCYQLYTKKPRKEEIEPSSVERLWNSEADRVFFIIKENLTINHSQLDAKAPIVVYDKNRKSIPLPKGATALDFAYTLSVEMGKHAVDAIINNRKAPLYRVLNSGDIIEIRTSLEAQVGSTPLHESFATTPGALRHIKESLNRRFPDRSGYHLLYQELERYHYMLTPEVFDEELETLVGQYSLGTPQEYLERLGEKAEQRYTPKWAAVEIMQQISERNEPLSTSTGRHSWIPKPTTQLTATKKPLQQRFCSSCRPSHPRDMNIMGRLHKPSGELIVHKESCPYLIDRLVGSRSAVVPMNWQLQPPAFRVAFFILAEDRLGLILDITKKLLRHQCNLLSINGNADTVKSGEARILFTIEAHTDNEVLDIWQELYKIDSVRQVEINAATTPMYVYDRLQKQRKQREAIPDNTALIIDSAESTVIRQPRNTILDNPFDISRPATEKMFFGRSTETATMQRELCGGKQGKALILYGPLRSGKSSICKNFLALHVQAPFWGVLFSLQNTLYQTEEAILRQLSEKISREFSEQLCHPGPEWQDYNDTDPEVRFRRILETCFDLIPEARLVLVLDEFGAALDSYRKHLLEYRFFIYWKELISEFPQLSLTVVLPMSSHSLLTSNKFVNIFSFAGPLPISFLDANSAQQLLVDPLREQNIEIHPNTVALALKLTGGNPYYMTLLGQQLIHYLNREIYQQLVTDTDLRLIIDQIIDRGSNPNFDFLVRELQNNKERRILEVIVELTNRSKQTKVQLKKIVAELNLPEATVRQHLDRLRSGLILDENGPPFNPYYSFKIDLVRRWLTRNRWFFSSITQKQV